MQLLLLGRQLRQGGGGRLLAAPQGGQLVAGHEDAHRPQLVGQGGVGAGGGGLALQGADLAAHLAQQVPQAFQVLLGGGQPALGPLPAPAVLQHPGRLLDHRPAVLGPGVEHRVQLALADDHVLLAPDPRVRQEVLDVQQPAGGAVDGVLAVPAAEQGPGDGHLGHVHRELARGVVDGERHLGPAQRRPAGGAGEDDVLHLGRAQRPRPLGPEHPGHGVHHVGLAAAVGPHHHGDPRLELQHRGVGEGLEPLHGERLQEHGKRTLPTARPAPGGRRGGPSGGLSRCR